MKASVQTRGKREEMALVSETSVTARACVSIVSKELRVLPLEPVAQARKMGVTNAGVIFQ